VIKALRSAKIINAALKVKALRDASTILNLADKIFLQEELNDHPADFEAM